MKLSTEVQLAVSGASYLAAAVILCLILTACSASRYRQQADQEVYRIIENAEESVFGRHQPFTIDTEYSARSAEEIQTGEIIEQRQIAQSQFLTLEEALDLAVRHSRDYQSEKEQLYLAALNLTGERFRFFPQFTGHSSTLTHNRGPGGEESTQLGHRLSVGQMLLAGTDVGVTLANDLIRYYTGNPRRRAQSVLSLNIAQPLLRGAGRAVVAEQLKQAERNVIYAVRSYTQFQKEFSVSIVGEYFSLLQLRDNVRNRFLDFQSRTNTTSRLKDRFEAGLETTVGVGQAEQAELAARNSYQNVIASYERQLDQFKIRLGIPLATELKLDDNELTDLTEAGLTATDLDPEVAYRIALTNQLELLNSIDRFEDRRRQVALVADNLRPDLRLTAGASLRSEGETDYAQFDLDDWQGDVGLQFNGPLNRLRERNQYRGALINFETAIRTLALDLDRKRNEIDNGLRSLIQFRENYRIQGMAVQLAEERVEGADLNIQANRATVRDLVEAQNELLAARNSLSAALVDYLNARLRLLLDIGILNTDIERYWLKPEASTIALDTVASEPANALEDKPVLSPEILFGNSS